jgi:hypothetical protein
MHQHDECMQEMTMLILYLLIEFRGFSVYSLQEPGQEFGAFQR